MSDSGDSLFQNKLLSLSTPCNTSILSTSIVIERDESIDRNVIQLKPSLNEIENILLTEVVSFNKNKNKFADKIISNIFHHHLLFSFVFFFLDGRISISCN